MGAAGKMFEFSQENFKNKFVTNLEIEARISGSYALSNFHLN